MSLSTTSSTALLISAVLILSVTTTSAIDITDLLEQLPEFTEFNNLLTKTQVADDINRRGTVTVLALTDDRVGEIANKPEDVQKRILSNHVILDYYDTAKLTELEVNKTCVLTTLFQASGIATDKEGFLYVVHNKDNSVVFGSAVNGAPLNSKLEESVASQQYRISVLSVTQPIIAPGIDGASTPVSTPPPSVPSPAADQVPPPAEKTPEVAPEADKVPPPPTAETPKTPADAPAVDKVSPPAEIPKTPADAPGADKVSPPAETPKTPADAPAAGSNTSAPASAEGDAPANTLTTGAQPADADGNQSPANAVGKQLLSGVQIGFTLALASAFIAVF